MKAYSFHLIYGPVQERSGEMWAVLRGPAREAYLQPLSTPERRRWVIWDPAMGIFIREQTEAEAYDLIHCLTVRHDPEGERALFGFLDGWGRK